MVCIKIYVHHSFYFIFQPDGCVELNFLLLGLKLTIHSHPPKCFSFNQLDLPEYTSKEQLQERLLLAIHEASEGFGFGWPEFNVILWPQQCQQSTFRVAITCQLSFPFYLLYRISYWSSALLLFYLSKKYLFGII